MDDEDPKASVMAPPDPLVMRASARVGTVLHQKWRLDVLLGVGGMAAVYAATHRNGSRCAVKILHAELSLDAQVRTRFLREGYVANSVGHEGAVRVTDDDTAQDGAAFLVMDLLDGETLEERRVRLGGQMSEDEVLSVADQLLDILAAAHAKGIVHRDIKPENIFLTREGRVKVLDFGIARLRELSAASSASTATRSGATMGTPFYMAPEQARGLWDEVDGRTDLWALGATMYQALTGDFVHDGRTTNEVLLAAMTKPAPAISTVLPGVSATVAQVVDRALEFEREARWRDAHHMQEAARHALRDRHGAPIATAPRLTVPETVPDRTLGGATSVLAPRLSTTGQPVTAGSTLRLSLGSLTSRSPKVAALGIGAAVTVGFALAGIVWAVASHHPAAQEARSSSAEPSSAPASTAAATAPSVPPSAGSGPPVAATDLPTAAASAASPPPAAQPNPKTIVATAAPAPGPAPIPTAPPVVPSPAAPGRPSCSPPFTVDPATGRKHFKAECL